MIDLETFLGENSNDINKLCIKLKNVSDASIEAARTIISIEIEKAYETFIANKHDPLFLNRYLFASINNTIEKIRNQDKKSVHICPACKYFDTVSICVMIGNMLVCNACSNRTVSAIDEDELCLSEAFARHSISGTRCVCNRFLPKNSICVYPDCKQFDKQAKVMRHPSIKIDMLTSITEDVIQPCNDVLYEQDISRYYDVLIDTIDKQSEAVDYCSNAATREIKASMYAAFRNIVVSNPIDMISYLVLLNRVGGLQCKIFQEFIRLFEKQFPIQFIQDDIEHSIVSLLDDKIVLFGGESEFTAQITNGSISNQTVEHYGCKPYYIGKLLDILDGRGKSLINNVIGYGFSNITIAAENQDVIVRHLRIPPHHQMMGLSHLNRIRRNIVDRVYYVLNGEKRVVSR